MKPPANKPTPGSASSASTTTAPPNKPAGPDVAEMTKRDLPKSAFPGRGAREFRVFLDAPVHQQVARHAAEDVSVEICGVLVGAWQSDEDGPYVSIVASIPGEAVANKLSEVTFTHETWAKIHQRMDAEFADKSIVGWYHTHPNFGIFLSERDCFIHEHFFREPGQVAYVVDPIRKEEGFFIWSKGKPTPASHYWVGRDVRVAPPIEGDNREPRDRKMTLSSADVSGGGGGGERSASRRDGGGRASEGELPPVYNWVTNVLFGLCLFLLGFTLSKYFANADRDRYVEANLTRYSILKSLKPGLGPRLAMIHRSLDEIGAAATALSHPTSQPVDQAPNWAVVAAKVAAYQKQINDLIAVYALSPQEEDELRKLDLSWLKQLQPDEPKPASQPTATSQPAAAASQPANETKK